MQKSTGKSISLGVFVLLGILLFIAGIYFVGQRQQLFNNTFRVSGIFKNINGLEVGDNVRFSGMNVGIIETILQITDSTVKVDMQINEDTRKFIKKNAIAVIGSDGLMGNKIVIIIPGGPHKYGITDNDIISTSQPVNMEDILAKLKITSDNAASITGDLSAIMKNISEGRGTIGKLFMDSAFAENVDATLLNISRAASGLNQNMNAASHNILLRGYFKKTKKNKK